MKNLLFAVVVVAGLILSACDTNNADPAPVIPGTQYIKARINGVPTVYYTLPDLQYNNYFLPGSSHFQFLKNSKTNEYWSMSLSYGYVATSLQDLPLPFTMTGPTQDFTGKTPEAHMYIIDPDGAPYGKLIANGSSFDHDFTVTITSVENNFIRGTFHGRGYGKFQQGEFAVQLKPEQP